MRRAGAEVRGHATAGGRRAGARTGQRRPRGRTAATGPDRYGRRDAGGRPQPSSDGAVSPAFAPGLRLDRDVLEQWADFDARIGVVDRRPDVQRAFDVTLLGG
jgi:hypothetical protein